MPDITMLGLLKSNIDEWNQWKKDNPNDIVDLTSLDLTGIDLARADLRKVDFSESRLSGVNLSRANLTGVRFCGAILRGVNFSGAILSGVDFCDSDLWRSMFDRADLRRAILKNLDFGEGILRWCDFRGADLSDSRLNSAILDKSDFSEANLTGADLHGAYLRSVKFWGTRLVKADFSKAVIASTLFINCDMTEVKGLNTCRHRGPSYLDIDTVHNSGLLPLIFLRGCGLSDGRIEELNNVHTHKESHYSCFISYSTKDDSFAKRIYDDLQNSSVRAWMSVEDIKGGELVDEQIDKAIQKHQKLLLVLSKDSIDSDWVKREIYKAFTRERKESKRILFPIRLMEYDALREWEYFDSDLGVDLAKEIRKYHIPDFSNWKEEKVYQKAFGNLLGDLKKEHKLN